MGIVGGLGEALFISAFLAITVDQYIKRKMLREVSDDVAKYLIGWPLLPELQDRIRSLMGCAIIRKNAVAHYKIEPSDERGMVCVEVNYSYDVENVTGHAEDFSPYLAIEPTDRPLRLELECESMDRQAKFKISKDVSQEDRNKPQPIELRKPKIRIAPNKDGAGPTYRVAGRYVLVQPERYTDVFHFGYPTLNMDVAADYPDEFEFAASGADVVTSKRWSFFKLFLAGEYIRVRWQKRASLSHAAESQ
jgi:hypothetical protein